MMRRLKLFLPVVIFAVLAVVFYVQRAEDPTVVSTATIGKPLPEFNLPTLDSNLSAQKTEKDLIGSPFLMNVWATWCATCLIEHPYFLELSRQGISIVGINYIDEAESAQAWLKKHGNPYSSVLFDKKGRLGFDLGVTGAPETFLVDAQGTVVYRHIGVVDKSVWEEHFSSLFSK